MTEQATARRSESITARYRAVLAIASFRRLIAAFLVDQIGSWAYSVVISLVIYDRSGGSPLWLAGQFAARWVVGLLASGHAGVLADRYDRIRLMQWTAALTGAVMVGLTVAVVVESPLWVLVALTALAALLNAPYGPAAGALLPDLVDESRLGTANSMLAVVENLVVVVGPAIGALLLLVGAPAFGIGLNAASFAAVVFIVGRIPVRSQGGAEAGTGLWAQWVDGLRALGSEARILVLVGYACVAEAVYGASTVVYAPLSERFGSGSHGYGYLLAATATGSVLGAGLADRLSTRTRVAAVLLAAGLVESLPFLVTAYVPDIGSAIALQVVSGGGYIVVTVLAMTALQRSLPGELLGRVLGVFVALNIVATLAGSFLLTPLLNGFGVVRSVEIIGIGFSAVVLLAYPAAVRADRGLRPAARDLPERVALLEALDLFADSTAAVLQRLAAHSEPVAMPDGAVLLRQGEPATDFYVLVEGRLSVRAVSDGHALSLPHVTAPGYVGELGLLHHRPRSATVTCAGPCRLLRIDGAEFTAALTANAPSVAFLGLADLRVARTAGPARRAGAGAGAPGARDLPALPLS